MSTVSTIEAEITRSAPAVVKPYAIGGSNAVASCETHQKQEHSLVPPTLAKLVNVKHCGASLRKHHSFQSVHTRT